jgi:hemerythrin-like domain-containing protein
MNKERRILRNSRIDNNLKKVIRFFSEVNDKVHEVNEEVLSQECIDEKHTDCSGIAYVGISAIQRR